MNLAVRGLIALLLALPAVAMALAFASAPATPHPQPTAYERGDNNFTAALQAFEATGLSVEAVVSTIALAPEGSLLVIAHAEEPWSERQWTLLQRHLDSGGSIWVAGGRSLSSWLGDQGAAMSTQRILQAGATSPGQVVLEATTDGDEQLEVLATVPRTLVLEEGAGWTPWLIAPGDTHLDVDGDGKIGQGDPPGPFVVGAFRRMESGGSLLVTADDSLLTNAAFAVPGAENGKFVQGAVGAIGPRSVVWDEAEQGWNDREGGLASAVATLQSADEVPLWAVLAAGALVGALAFALGRQVPELQSFRRHQPHETDQAVGETTPDVTAIAWELLADTTGRPLAELQAAGANAAHGLAEDPRLRRVLTGQGSAQDQQFVLTSFTQREESSP